MFRSLCFGHCVRSLAWFLKSPPAPWSPFLFVVFRFQLKFPKASLPHHSISKTYARSAVDLFVVDGNSA